MTIYEVDCPICVEQGVVEIGPEYGIYRIEGYKRRPRFRIVNRNPTAALGEKLFLERDKQTRLSVYCDTGHFLRAISAAFYYIPPDKCLYGPERIPPVECPYCRYRYGGHRNFIHRADTRNGKSIHILRSVTKYPKPGHTEVTAMTRQKCTNNERVANRRDCPNCGNYSYFNYRTVSVDPDVTFARSGQTEH